MPDEHGVTRVDKYERMNQPVPTLDVPEFGRYLWDWYFDISGRIRRMRDGVCEPIPPSEYVAWVELTGSIIYPSEFAILCAMDDQYCSEMSNEAKDYRQRLQDEAKKGRK
jgi:hypothetical protein